MNTERFAEVLEWARSNPQRDQSNWCGTSHCFAGEAQLLAGKRANEATVEADAMAYLEIDDLAAAYLFAPNRTIADFERYLAMDDEQQFDACVAARPGWALAYAADRLSAKQFDACVKAEPEAALKYAVARLSAEQRKWCEERV